jgi:hypothetical protein
LPDAIDKGSRFFLLDSTISREGVEIKEVSLGLEKNVLQTILGMEGYGLPPVGQEAQEMARTMGPASGHMV